MKVILPYPDPELSPNRKNGKHWSATKKSKDAAFAAGYYLTMEASLKSGELILRDKIPLDITFVQCDKRRRDLDNLLASAKPACDGIAKALGIDDIQFEPITLKRDYDKSGSRMVVEITLNVPS